MEMHQLEYVLAVAKYHNFTRAAEEIKISQSSLSQQINKLENELGTSLFVRTTRSVQLTPAGAEFVVYAQRIMSEVEKARRSIEEYVSMVKGEITIGTIAVIGNYKLPNLIKSFQDSFPGIRVNLVEEQCEELLSMLHASKIDAAFVQIKEPMPNFNFCPLIYDRMTVVVSKNHPLANRVSVDITELKNEKFIMTPPTSGNYKDFVKASQAVGYEPNVVLSCAIVKTMLGFVREDVGITALSSQVALAEKDASLRVIGLTPTIKRRISLATRNTDDIPPTIKVFKKFTAQWLEEQRAIDRSKKSAINSSFTSHDIRLIYSK